MKTLYISDMDGTLLNDGGKVSRRSVEIINELIKKRYAVYRCYRKKRNVCRRAFEGY